MSDFKAIVALPLAVQCLQVLNVQVTPSQHAQSCRLLSHRSSDGDFEGRSVLLPNLAVPGAVFTGTASTKACQQQLVIWAPSSFGRIPAGKHTIPARPGNLANCGTLITGRLHHPHMLLAHRPTVPSVLHI
jgi:hypothetical protein